jgi:hypothetical protein
MSFKYDWNIEVLAQFHATFFHEDTRETIHWMTEGVHYKIDFTTFAWLFGFSKEDKDAEIVHFETHMNQSMIALAYEYEDLADGSTTALKSVYYVLNNMFRETIYPKGGSDSTSLRRFAPNLLARMLHGAKSFSVSKFIWYNLTEVTESGKCNLPYAPYIMYMIEMVSGISFKKDVVVWTSLGPLPRWVPGPTTRWAPRTTRLVPHGTCWREAQGLRWRSTRIGSYTYHVLCRGLLYVHD